MIQEVFTPIWYRESNKYIRTLLEEDPKIFDILVNEPIYVCKIPSGKKNLMILAAEFSIDDPMDLNGETLYYPVKYYQFFSVFTPLFLPNTGLYIDA